MNIVLTGFMGSGKSTVGKALAAKKGMKFIDLDSEFEKAEGKKIHEVFGEKRQGYFRTRETEILEKHSKQKPDNTVFATGGGVVLSEKNRALLKGLGKVVWLEISADEAHARTKNQKHRPLLNHPDRKGTINRILAARRDLYSKADIKIKVDGKAVGEVVGEIIGRTGRAK